MVTIGVFDGVHRGHQELIRQAVGEARRRSVPCVVTTFDPHPVAVFLPDQAPAQLTTLEERVRLCATLGVDAVLVVNFTRELAGLNTGLYFTSLIMDTLKAQAVFVGENFTFGRDASGSSATLKELGEANGVDVHIVPLVHDDGECLCSTLVRTHLAAGDVSGANWVLGRRFSVTAKVVHGAGRGGKELGYPTANQYFPESMALPTDGVYAAWLTVVDGGPIVGDITAGRRYPAAVSVGTNPTFGDEQRSVESYVIGRSADLYGHTARVDFVAWLRDMKRFSGVEELLTAMARDVAKAKELLGADAQRWHDAFAEGDYVVDGLHG